MSFSPVHEANSSLMENNGQKLFMAKAQAVQMNAHFKKCAMMPCQIGRRMIFVIC
jgi:hypothetical protein